MVHEEHLGMEDALLILTIDSLGALYIVLVELPLQCHEHRFEEEAEVEEEKWLWLRVLRGALLRFLQMTCAREQQEIAKHVYIVCW